MDPNRYHFSNFIEGDDLSIIAVHAKDVFQRHDEIVNIFRDNNKILYSGHPPSVIHFVKENNKSIFSSSSKKEGKTKLAKSIEIVSTPTRSNPDTSDKDDEAEKKEYHSATLEFTLPIRSQKIKAQPTVKVTPSPTKDESGEKDKQFTSQLGSTDRKEFAPSAQVPKILSNLSTPEKEFESPQKEVGKVEASSQESPRSAQIAKMTADLAMTEKEFESPKKDASSIEATRKESPGHPEISKMTLNLAVTEKDFKSPTKVVGAMKRKNEESRQCAEVTRISDVAVHDEGSGSIIPDEGMARISAANEESLKPEEDAGKSEKDSTSHVERMNITEPAITEGELPSPVKKSKTCSVETSDIQEISSPSKDDSMEEDSPEDIEATTSDESKIPSKETIEELAGFDRKSSCSPKKGIQSPFKSIPKVIKLAGEEEIGIEVVDLEYGVSPTTSRSKSADSRIDSTKGSSIESLVLGESETDSSKTDPSGVSEASSASIDTATLSMIEVILAFEDYLISRDYTVKEFFTSFLTFSGNIDLVKNYVFSLSFLLMKLDTSGKCTGKEFEDIFEYANPIIKKLVNKLKTWKKDVNFDIENWHKCFQQIEQLKERYEPLLTNESRPAVTFEVLQKYESEMRAIWKKMGDITILIDSRRTLFSIITHDVERLIKMVVKYLILAGILLPF